VITVDRLTKRYGAVLAVEKRIGEGGQDHTRVGLGAGGWTPRLARSRPPSTTPKGPHDQAALGISSRS